MTGKSAHLQDKNRRESQNFKGNVRARSAVMVNKSESLIGRGSTNRSRT
jgi:hypothetical protein